MAAAERCRPDSNRDHPSRRQASFRLNDSIKTPADSGKTIRNNQPSFPNRGMRALVGTCNQRPRPIFSCRLASLRRSAPHKRLYPKQKKSGGLIGIHMARSNLPIRTAAHPVTPPAGRFFRSRSVVINPAASMANSFSLRTHPAAASQCFKGPAVVFYKKPVLDHGSSPAAVI